jgi:ribonuclease HI
MRAELTAMFLALSNTDPDKKLVVMTDSMNTIQALATWGRAEYFRDMNRQRCADIMRTLLGTINNRGAPVHVVKVKSHHGVQLNEEADAAAGEAASSEGEGYATLFDQADDNPPPFTFSWWDENNDTQPTSTSQLQQVTAKWRAESLKAAVETAVQRGSLASSFLLSDPAPLRYVQHSKAVRAWTATEHRRWMQMATRIFPTNSYLQRIGKHPTGHCPWCPGVRESQTHLQCQCPQFANNRIAAHHSIVQATVAALKGLCLPHWEFFYETPLSALPFDFEWESTAQAERELPRRPDCVMYNKLKRTVLILEFTRAMDNPSTLAAALAAKTAQYAKAAAALRRAQIGKPPSANTLDTVEVIPLIFGVRGTVLEEPCQPLFTTLGLKKAQATKVLATGARSAIEAASAICAARRTALRPHRP